MKAENLTECLLTLRELQGVVMMLDLAYKGAFTISEQEGEYLSDAQKEKLKTIAVENLINRKNDLIEKLKSL